MENSFALILCELRKKKGYSQRRVAADLGISQALLSHYEKGLREPGLAFVVKACDYYGVTADYLLGRTREDGQSNSSDIQIKNLITQLRELADIAESYIK